MTKLIKNSNHLSYRELKKIQEDTYISNLKASKGYEYLHTNIINLSIKVILVFILTCISLWVIYGYFGDGNITTIPQNPVAISIIFFWLGLTQIYTWNVFHLFKNNENETKKVISPGGCHSKEVWQDYLYGATRKYFIFILKGLAYFIGYIGIWFSLFNGAKNMLIALYTYLNLNIIYYLFYRFPWAIIGFLVLLFFVYYIIFTNKNDRIEGELYSNLPTAGKYSGNIFCGMRDNRAITKGVYIILSFIVPLLLGQGIIMYSDAPDIENSYFGQYVCTSSCSLYKKGFSYIEKLDYDYRDASLIDSCYLDKSQSFIRGCEHYVLNYGFVSSIMGPFFPIFLVLSPFFMAQ